MKNSKFLILVPFIVFNFSYGMSEKKKNEFKKKDTRAEVILSSGENYLNKILETEFDKIDESEPEKEKNKIVRDPEAEMKSISPRPEEEEEQEEQEDEWEDDGEESENDLQSPRPLILKKGLGESSDIVKKESTSKDVKSSFFFYLSCVFCGADSNNEKL